MYTTDSDDEEDAQLEEEELNDLESGDQSPSLRLRNQRVEHLKQSEAQKRYRPKMEIRSGPDGNDVTVTYCIRCNVDVTEDMYHCSECDVCIYGFDHHCVFFSKCIGGGNIYCFGGSLAMIFVNLGYLFGVMYYEEQAAKILQ